LLQTKQGIRLTQVPAKEMEVLREEHVQLRNATWADAESMLSRHEWPEALEIDAELQLQDSQDFGFVVRKGDSYGTRVGYDATWSDVYVDRSHSGDVVIGPTFAARHEAPIAIQGGRIRLHILLDRSSVEVFADNGLVTITDLIYPRSLDKGLAVYAKGKPPTVIWMDIWTLKGWTGQH
jgi:sucrose-6-phosphate hydrolase SacC (GH32 family)